MVDGMKELMENDLQTIASSLSQTTSKMCDPLTVSAVVE